MSTERKLVTQVQSGGRIEVIAPDLAVGETVEITIRKKPPSAGKRSALDILAEAPGHRLFKTAEEVDAYIREERDSWDR
jgi:hypothetical protein